MNKLVEKAISGWSYGGAVRDVEGGEILRHIGSEVLYAKFKKNPENGGWDNELQMTTLDYVGDYDPMTGTYLARHTLKGSGEKVETRIMSAGFEWGDPEEKGVTSRLLPLSHHYKLMETELYFERLRSMYFKNQGVLGIDQIQAMAGKNSKEGLEHILWIAAVIDSETDLGVKKGILSFRIVEVSGLTKRVRSWSFNLRSADGTFMTVPKFTQEEDGTWIARNFSWNGEVLGDLKIMDIESPREEVPSE